MLVQRDIEIKESGKSWKEEGKLSLFGGSHGHLKKSQDDLAIKMRRMFSKIQDSRSTYKNEELFYTPVIPNQNMQWKKWSLHIAAEIIKY